MIVSTSFLKEGNYSNFIKELNESNTDMIHYDVMDGKFVDNTNLKTVPKKPAAPLAQAPSRRSKPSANPTKPTTTAKTTKTTTTTTTTTRTRTQSAGSGRRKH